MVEFLQCTNRPTAFEWKMQYSCFPVLPGSAEAQIIWSGILKCLWLLTSSVTFLPKISKSVHVCRSYSKPKVARFWDTVHMTQSQGDHVTSSSTGTDATTAAAERPSTTGWHAYLIAGSVFTGAQGQIPLRSSSRAGRRPGSDLPQTASSYLDMSR